MSVESVDRRIRHLFEAALVLTGICVFAWFIHGSAAQLVIALAALSFSAVVISLSASNVRSLLTYLSPSRFSKKTLVYSLAGLALGILWALLYRGISKVSLLPQTLTFIALIAPMIGITEELLFRGFLQGKLSSINIYAAIVLTSFAHTLYKYLVLRSLPSDIGTDFFLLIVVTFIAGLMFGVLRVLSRSIIPSCLTHGVFDVLVYGGFSTWPVWVWS
jgi:membrane protease YdiL (CAAX protease family)